MLGQQNQINRRKEQYERDVDLMRILQSKGTNFSLGSFKIKFLQNLKSPKKQQHKQFSGHIVQQNPQIEDKNKLNSKSFHNQQNQQDFLTERLKSPNQRQLKPQEINKSNTNLLQLKISEIIKQSSKNPQNLLEIEREQIKQKRIQQNLEKSPNSYSRLQTKSQYLDLSIQRIQQNYLQTEPDQYIDNNKNFYSQRNQLSPQINPDIIPQSLKDEIYNETNGERGNNFQRLKIISNFEVNQQSSSNNSGKSVSQGRNQIKLQLYNLKLKKFQKEKSQENLIKELKFRDSSDKNFQEDTQLNLIQQNLDFIKTTYKLLPKKQVPKITNDQNQEKRSRLRRGLSKQLSLQTVQGKNELIEKYDYIGQFLKKQLILKLGDELNQKCCDINVFGEIFTNEFKKFLLDEEVQEEQQDSQDPKIQILIQQELQKQQKKQQRRFSKKDDSLFQSTSQFQPQQAKICLNKIFIDKLRIFVLERLKKYEFEQKDIQQVMEKFKQYIQKQIQIGGVLRDQLGEIQLREQVYKKVVENLKEGLSFDLMIFLDYDEQGGIEKKINFQNIDRFVAFFLEDDWEFIQEYMDSPLSHLVSAHDFGVIKFQIWKVLSEQMGILNTYVKTILEKLEQVRVQIFPMNHQLKNNFKHELAKYVLRNHTGLDIFEEMNILQIQAFLLRVLETLLMRTDPLKIYKTYTNIFDNFPDKIFTFFQGIFTSVIPSTVQDQFSYISDIQVQIIQMKNIIYTNSPTFFKLFPTSDNAKIFFSIIKEKMKWEEFLIPIQQQKPLIYLIYLIYCEKITYYDKEIIYKQFKIFKKSLDNLLLIIVQTLNEISPNNHLYDKVKQSITYFLQII